MARSRASYGEDGLTIEFVTEGFEAFVRSLLTAIPHEVEERAIRKVAIDFLSRVIPRTPVDTGRARAGWQSYLLDHGHASPVTGRDPQAIVEGTAEGTWSEKFTQREAFVEIVNAVEYIVFLEYGSSDQAPAGMMRITFKEFEAGDRLTKALREELRGAIRKADREAERTTKAALRRRGEL